MSSDLIVCYSYSGNTYKIAEEIQRQTGAHLCEIYPKQPYTVNFDDLLELAKKETDNGSYPSLFPIDVQVENYKRIIVGTPIWCETISPPIASWLASQDLSQKTVIPFWSHCGNIGDVGTVVRQLCPKSNVCGDLPVFQAGGDTLSYTIEKWLTNLPD